MNTVVEKSFVLPSPVSVGSHNTTELRFVKPTVQDNWRLAYSSALNFLKTNEAVEDSEEFSDALLGLWKAIEIWTPERAANCKWTTHAIRCMRNAIIDGRKQRSYRERLVDFNTFEPVAPSFDNALVEELSKPQPHDTDRLRRAKKLLYDYYILGKTFQEIGKTDGVSAQAVHQLVKHAVALLRRRYKIKEKL